MSKSASYDELLLRYSELREKASALEEIVVRMYGMMIGHCLDQCVDIEEWDDMERCIGEVGIKL